MSKNYRVSLGFNTDKKTYMANVASGIFHQSQSQDSISYEMLFPWFAVELGVSLHKKKCSYDASITGVREETLDRVRDNPIPTVLVGPEGLLLDHPWVGPDYDKIAATACEFFASRGYTNLTYFHSDNAFYPQCKLLLTGIQKHAEQRNLKHTVFCHDIENLQPSSYPMMAQLHDLVSHLKTLPKPCAVFALDDHHAWRVVEACRIAGFKIPQEVSILGVRSDDYLCEFTQPPLSHVYIDYDEVGRLAAQVVGDLLTGKPVPRRTYTSNVFVRERGSTQRHVIQDPIVERCVAFMENNLHESFSMEKVAQNSHVSRRTLLRRFRESLNKAPVDVMRELRLNLAKRLLCNTSISLTEVAFRCGLSDQSQLNRIIRKSTGKTPASYRKDHTI